MKESYSIPCDVSQIYLPFKEACKDLRLTYTELADGSGVSLSIVQKIMSGTTKNPHLADLVDMAKYLNKHAGKMLISLDELCGLKTPKHTDTEISAENERLKQENKKLNSDLNHKSELYEAAKKENEYHRKSAKNTRIVLFVVLAALFTLLVLDCLNGGWGYIRYAMEQVEGNGINNYLLKIVNCFRLFRL